MKDLFLKLFLLKLGKIVTEVTNLRMLLEFLNIWAF